MKIFKVWMDSTEQRTNFHESWTERELLDAYSAETTCGPCIYGEFSEKSSALEYYNTLNPATPHESLVASGRVIIYTVAGVDEVELDDNGELVTSRTIAMKASPLIY